MRVLIVESDPNLGWLWKRHLERFAMTVTLAADQEAAVNHLEHEDVEIIVMDLVLNRGSAIAVADYAAYRRPKAKVVFVTNTSFFSDGSIFQHISNACAFLPSATPPEDIAAVVEHYGTSA
ncbi:response regulator [Defluviimonas aestuarii]|uniref:response regulator n=1 Tax=Albidovulum aestuarii TaxID=1130726 RepID=UPI00249BAA28|nr:response regulator [Defluviimonas aestuarii]MDI3338252.1 response regulator [Defluviimonas aestuarii]